jgi:hypothetical protein
MTDDKKDDTGAVIGGVIVLGLAALAIGALTSNSTKKVGGDGGGAEKSVEISSKIEGVDERALCKEASDRGEDVCWHCRTVNPSRCDIGHCVEPGGCGGGNSVEYCGICAQNHIDSTTND